jgi:hypothetical protein
MSMLSEVVSIQHGHQLELLLLLMHNSCCCMLSLCATVSVHTSDNLQVLFRDMLSY